MNQIGLLGLFVGLLVSYNPEFKILNYLVFFIDRQILRIFQAIGRSKILNRSIEGSFHNYLDKIYQILPNFYPYPYRVNKTKYVPFVDFVA